MEMGAKVAFTPVDETLISWLRLQPRRQPVASHPDYEPDLDARYERLIDINVEDEFAEPQVACPHAVDNVRPVSELHEVHMQQAVLGSCTNGRLEDLGVAARILAGNRVHPDTRLIVIPASQRIYLEAMRPRLHVRRSRRGSDGKPARLRPVRRCSPGHSRRPGKPASRARIAISSAAWAAATRSCILPPRPWWRHPPIAGRIVHPAEVMEGVAV